LFIPAANKFFPDWNFEIHSRNADIPYENTSVPDWNFKVLGWNLFVPVLGGVIFG
jgi:hypothetical protein